MKRVIQRAQASGDVRPDITDADIVSLMWANGRIVEATSRVAPNAWRRHLYLMMDAFRAANRHELPEPPLTDRSALSGNGRPQGMLTGRPSGTTRAAPPAAPCTQPCRPGPSAS